MAKAVETEKCVLCGRQTDVTVTAHVDARSHYVEGAGQLCPGCWNETYPAPVRRQ